MPPPIIRPGGRGVCYFCYCPEHLTPLQWYIPRGGVGVGREAVQTSWCSVCAMFCDIQALPDVYETTGQLLPSGILKLPLVSPWFCGLRSQNPPNAKQLWVGRLAKTLEMSHFLVLKVFCP